MTKFGKRLFNTLSSHFRTLSNPIPFQEHYGFADRLRSLLKAKVLLWARRRNLFWMQKPDRAISELAYILQHIAAFEQLYDSFGDENSKDCLIEALNLRILGPYYVKAGVNTQRYWDHCHETERHSIKRRETVRKEAFPLCHHFVLARGSMEMNCHASIFGIGTTFFLEQYAYRTDQVCICASEGDVVIDGGGYLGETALYFAEKVAPSGKVFTFEFNHAALDILQENLQLNPELARSAEVVAKALWHKSNVRMNYISHGPSTRLCKAEPSAAASDAALDVATISIDDFVRQKELSRVDFIKMDIEGAELRALQGTAETLRRCRPKLAIALYHRIQDFLAIPAHLRAMDLGYKYYLRHAYMDATETVLFAAPENAVHAP